MIFKVLRKFTTQTKNTVPSLPSILADKMAPNKVVVWSKSYCPYCVKATRILNSLKVSFDKYEVD